MDEKKDWWIDEKELQEFIRKSIEENEEAAKRELAKERQEKIQKILSNSGLGKRFYKRKFENFTINDSNKKAYEEAKRFVQEFPREQGLMFVGSVGTGKTHLAASIVNELVSNMHNVVFGNSADIIARMRKSFSGGDSDIDIIEKITSSDLVVIDDLGKEKESEYTSTIIYQIINRLYEDEKPIVITTNCTSEMLLERLGDKGESILSRLMEMCIIVNLNGEDWRYKKWKQS